MVSESCDTGTCQRAEQPWRDVFQWTRRGARFGTVLRLEKSGSVTRGCNKHKSARSPRKHYDFSRASRRAAAGEQLEERRDHSTLKGGIVFLQPKFTRALGYLFAHTREIGKRSWVVGVA